MHKIGLYIVLGIVILALISMFFSSLSLSTVEDDTRPTFVIIYDNILTLVQRVCNIFNSIGDFILDVIETFSNIITSIVDWFESFFSNVPVEHNIVTCVCENSSLVDINKDCICDVCNNPFAFSQLTFSGNFDECNNCGEYLINHYHSIVDGGIGDCYYCGWFLEYEYHHYGNCCD